jgi:hypothetical protein
MYYSTKKSSYIKQMSLVPFLMSPRFSNQTLIKWSLEKTFESYEFMEQIKFKNVPYRNWGSLSSKVQCINNSAFCHLTIKKVLNFMAEMSLNSFVLTTEVPILVKHPYSFKTNWNLLVLSLCRKSCLLEVPQIYENVLRFHCIY